jgi:tRNA modification GTPase
VIIGKPNTGKSSLYNALSREEAAIVTSTPGTTRDALEIWLDVHGIPVLLSDTAGIRESEEEIETLGIERAKEQYLKADVSIFLIDGSKALSKEDFDIANGLDGEKKHIVVINKTDLPHVTGAGETASLLKFFNISKDEIIRISLIDDESSGMNEKTNGIKAIECRIEELVTSGVSAGASILITKARQKALLEAAAEEIKEAKNSLAKNQAPEFAEVNIRAAWENLGELIGEQATDDVIDRVFEEFCVGK